METPPPPRTAADYAAASALFCLHRTTAFYTLPAAAALGAPHQHQHHHLHPHDLQAAQTLYALATTPAADAVDDMETEDDDAAGAKNRGVGYGEPGPACVGPGRGGGKGKKKKGVYPTPDWTGSEEGVGQEQVGPQEEGGARAAVVTKSGRQSKRPKRWGG